MYKLHIASLAPKNKGKNFQQYLLDSVPTIGAFGDEPYEIRFYNKSSKKLQIRLSVDGTDIITGKQATTEASGSMWVVNAYDKLVIKAWPENQKGGASFLFTSNEAKTVAANTHGDVSHKGIIAAAVFVEGYVAPTPAYRPSSWSGGGGQRYGSSSFGSFNSTRGVDVGDDGSRGVDVAVASAKGAECASGSMDYMEVDRERSILRGGRLRSSAGTGAGAYQKQEIQTVAGLIKPTLETTIRLRYIWWDEVVEKLKALGNDWDQVLCEGEGIPSGFPGNQAFSGIDLKSTPRPRRPEPNFARFSEGA